MLVGRQAVNRHGSRDPRQRVFNLSTKDYETYQEYQDYLAILSNLNQNDKYLDELDTNQLSVLKLLAAKSVTLPNAYARNALVFIDTIDYTEPYVLPEIAFKVDESEESYEKSNTMQSALEIYPNPAKSYITVEYDINNKGSQSCIEIFNIEGILVKRIELSHSERSTIIPLGSAFKPGMYLCRLKCDSKVVDTQKITIIR